MRKIKLKWNPPPAALIVTGLIFLVGTVALSTLAPDLMLPGFEVSVQYKTPVLLGMAAVLIGAVFHIPLRI